MAFSKITAGGVDGGVGDSLRPNANPLIINGDMAVAQRGTSSASISTGGYYTCDRWKFEHTGNAGTFTLSQSTDVPSGYGFANSFKMDCTTAQGTIGSGNRIGIRQFFEGQDLQLIKKVTANAEKITLAFWVKSTKTGTFIAELYDEDNARQVSKAYTVSTTNTWEFKVINFPADTTGAFDNDNASSMVLFLWTGGGTNFTSGTLNTSWASATSANRAVGQVNASDSTSNDFLITGVQLEVGEYTSSTLPDFQHESFADNFSRCARYFFYTGGGSTYASHGVGNEVSATAGYVNIHLITPMRSAPSVTHISQVVLWDGNGESNIDSIGNVYYANYGSILQVGCVVNGGIDDTAGITAYSSNDTTSGFELNAEL